MPNVVYLVPLTLAEAVNIEAILSAAALAFDQEAEESLRHRLPRGAATARKSAAEARRLKEVMRAALDRAVPPGGRSYRITEEVHS
jgi:hypothetical protein